MILESTDVPYRSESPEIVDHKERQIFFKPFILGPLPPTADFKKENVSSQRLPTPVSNVKSGSHSNREVPLNNQSTQSRQTIARPLVIVPALSLSRPGDRVDVENRVSTKRRKLNTGEDEKTASRLRDQKAEADSALVKLQDLLHEIFEAEDQIQPDTSGAEIQASAIFKPPNTIEDLGPVLASDTHTVLQKSIQKVTNYNRLVDVPTEYLNRVQKLCEGPIISAQTTDLKLDDNLSEDDTQNWLKQLEDMRNALLAINTLLHTMPGDVSMENLCPEDLIQAIPTVLNQVFDYCIIPAVECRPNGKDSALFNFFSSNKQSITGLTHQIRKVLGLLASFLSRVDVAEGTITATEFLATKLIFVENAHNDKESTLGFQKYEAVRRGAMDVLAKIFAKYPDQRGFILDEILVSLEKLPSTRQSARQFKLVDGKNIQLLSALVIQLVQTTAMQKSSRTRNSNRRKPIQKLRDDNKPEGSLSSFSDDDDDNDDAPPGGNNKQNALLSLSSQVDSLYDNAVRSAQYITKFIVRRAMTSTKTGDQPYRNILDLFTEDLIGVLGSTDWPAAELLLRVLASQMVGIAEHDKSPANAKNMALEILGWMGSAISDLSSTAQHLMHSVSENKSESSDYLQQLFDDHSNRSLHLEDLVDLEGPYRLVLEYLQERDLGNWQLSSARGYLLAQWAKTACNVYNDSADGSENSATDELAEVLTAMLSDSRWLETNR